MESNFLPRLQVRHLRDRPPSRPDQRKTCRDLLHFPVSRQLFTRCGCSFESLAVQLVGLLLDPRTAKPFCAERPHLNTLSKNRNVNLVTSHEAFVDIPCRGRQTENGAHWGQSW